MTHGGKREGAGRLPMPARKRARNHVGIRLTDAERRALEALQSQGHTLRDVLLAGVQALQKA